MLGGVHVGLIPNSFVRAVILLRCYIYTDQVIRCGRPCLVVDCCLGGFFVSDRRNNKPVLFQGVFCFCNGLGILSWSHHNYDLALIAGRWGSERAVLPCSGQDLRRGLAGESWCTETMMEVFPASCQLCFAFISFFFIFSLFCDLKERREKKNNPAFIYPG